MKFNRNSINYLAYPLLFLVLFYLIYNINESYILDDFEPKKLDIGVELKVEEEDIFQLFYRDSVTKFNERMSRKIPIEGSQNFQWVKFAIPDTLKLSQIRFDFGNKHKSTPIEIRKFILRYNGNIRNLSKDSLMTYFKANQYVSQESNGVFGRKIIGKRSDPFLLSQDLRPIINQLRQKKNHSRIALNIVLSLLLSGSILVALKQKNKSKNIVVGSHQIFVCTFVLLTILPFLDNLFLFDNSIIEEKRELVDQPSFNYENVNEYPTAFENYFNDHFGFRNKLISYGGVLKAKIFDTSPSEEKVIMGTENWFFYWKPDIRSSYKNERPFSERGLEDFSQMIFKTNNWAKSNNKIFLATIYPNKHSVYEEHLPSRIRNLKKDTLDKTDAAFNIFQEKNVLHVKHLENFFRNRSKRQLYFKNDTHWNSYGAFYGYRAIMDQLHSIDSEIESPLQMEDFVINANRDVYHGDLMDFMGIDNRARWFAEKAPIFEPIKEMSLVRKINFMGPRTVLIENRSINNKKVILLVGDSFSNELLKFLPLNFQKTYFLRSIRLNDKIIEKIQPDAVVYGIVERNLENF